MTTRPSLAGRPIPASFPAEGETIRVDRAWPRGEPSPDGGIALRVEGRDGAGRLRAAQLTLVPDADDPGEFAVVSADVAPAGRDPKLPALAAASGAGELLVHRFGRRAVVKASDRFVKVVRPSATEALMERTSAGRALARAAGFDAPTVLAAAPGVVELSVVPGRSIFELAPGTEDAAWAAAWATWAGGWPAFARGDGAGLPAHTADDERRIAEEWLGRALGCGVLTDPDGGLARRLESVVAGLAGGTHQPPVVSHRDLHDKQVLVANGGVGVLDLDTAALAEPALDLANLAVHAALRVDQGVWTPAQRDVAGLAIGSAARELGVDAARFRAYADATALRLACLYAFRPRARDLAGAWAAALAADETALTNGSPAAHLAIREWVA